MKIDEMLIEGTIVKFFDDYIREDKRKGILKTLDLLVADAIDKSKKEIDNL